MTSHEFIIIGGGIVGAAIAEGLARQGKDVGVLDEGDVAIRAARGNLGNVWVQGKGAAYPAYADLTRQAALDWGALAERLQAQTGIDIHFRAPGAVYLCFTDADLENRAATMRQANEKTAIDNPYEMLDHAALARMIPQIGPDVAGGSFSAMDGTANPLYLLRALIQSTQMQGGAYYPDSGVTTIREYADGFEMQTAKGIARARHVVLGAGLGNATLAPQLGMFGGVRPVRGQIMVTERMQPFLPCGTNFIRQTVEGGCGIGESSEEAGFDTGTTIDILAETARRATRAFPHLAHARIVRSWGALRIMTADGVPVYQMKGFGPDGTSKATVVSVHSGVTLAPFHCDALARQIGALALEPDIVKSFSAERFDV